MNLEGDDQLAWVVESSGQDEILLVTRQGKAIRFSEDEVRLMGLSAGGVLAVKLGTDDAVVGMGAIHKDSQVIIFTEQGYARRTAAKGFPTQKRYGGGVQAAKLSSRTGPVAVAALAAENQSLVLMAAQGRVIQVPVKAIHATGRAAVGHRIRKDTQEPYVELATHGAPILAYGAGWNKGRRQAGSCKGCGVQDGRDAQPRIQSLQEINLRPRTEEKNQQ